jgi:uncharacterized protein involved in outer membrane biogenesis
VKKAVITVVAVAAIVIVSGTIAVRALLDPERVRQTLERQASEALGQSVTIGRAELAVWPRAGVRLTNLVVGDPAALTLTRTDVSTSLRALFDRRIEDAEIVVQDSELDLPLVLATLDRLRSPGRAPAGGDGPEAEGSMGVTLVNVRTLALGNVRIRAGSRSAVFNMESSLDGDRLVIQSASVASDVTSLEATGIIESLANRKGRLSFKAETLDLDGLVAFAQEFARPAMPPGAAVGSGTASFGPLDLTLELEAARGDAAGVSFQNLAATAVVTPARIRFDPLAMGLFGGGLKGTMTVDMSGDQPAFAVNGALTGVDMTELTRFAGQPGSVTGTLNGTVSATGRGIDPARAMARARGQGTASITDGTVKGLQLVRPIVLAFGKPDAAQPVDGGERFSRMSANYSLAGGVVTLSNLAFQSRDVELDGAGTLTVEGRALDIRANARLSKELTAQAGRDLVRYTAEDGRVTVPVTVTGPLDAPSVGVN